MIRGYLTAVVLMILISALWLLVQRLWGRQFPDRMEPDGDALATRGSCHGCTCAGHDCHQPPTNTTNSEAT